jgi:hypothetical protein
VRQADLLVKELEATACIKHPRWRAHFLSYVKRPGTDAADLAPVASSAAAEKLAVWPELPRACERLWYARYYGKLMSALSTRLSGLAGMRGVPGSCWRFRVGVGLPLRHHGHAHPLSNIEKLALPI